MIPPAERPVNTLPAKFTNIISFRNKSDKKRPKPKRRRRAAGPLPALKALAGDPNWHLKAAHAAPGLKIKAAGGISTLQDAADFLALGASRLGTSRIVKIVKEMEGHGK